MGIYAEYIKLGIAILAIAGGIYSAYYRLKFLVTRLEDKLVQEKEDRIKDIQSEKEGRIKDVQSVSDDMTDFLTAFKDNFGEYKSSVSKLQEHVNNMSNVLSRLDEKVDSFIKNQETICRLNHRWNGSDRRKDC